MTSLRRDYEKLSAHEILTEASLSAARNEVEAAKLLDYNVVDYRLSCRRVELEQLEEELQEAETIIDRVVIELQLRYVNEELDSYQNRLLELSQTKPLQDLIHRELEIRREQEYEEFRRRCRERHIIRKNAALRGSIKNVSSSLITYITKPTNQMYIPEALKESVAEFLASIDFVSAKANPDSFTTATWKGKMQNLHTVLNALKDGRVDDKGMMEGFDMDLLDAMRDFQKENEGKTLFDMGTKSLEDLYLITSELRLNILKNGKERSIITRNRNKEICNCIKNESSSLITYLTNTYNQKYVPEIIKKHVIEFLESIDTVSSENKSSVKWSEKMKNVESVLRALYNAAKARTMDDKGMMKDFNMEIPNIMHRFVKENESMEISEMDTSQLNDLFVIIKALRLNITQR